MLIASYALHCVDGCCFIISMPLQSKGELMRYPCDVVPSMHQPLYLGPHLTSLTDVNNSHLGLFLTMYKS